MSAKMNKYLFGFQLNIQSHLYFVYQANLLGHRIFSQMIQLTILHVYNEDHRYYSIDLKIQVHLYSLSLVMPLHLE